MRTNLLRSVAVALGITVSGPTLADYGQTDYRSPSKWSNFNVLPADTAKSSSQPNHIVLPVSTGKQSSPTPAGGNVEVLPAPVPQAVGGLAAPQQHAPSMGAPQNYQAPTQSQSQIQPPVQQRQMPQPPVMNGVPVQSQPSDCNSCQTGVAHPGHVQHQVPSTWAPGATVYGGANGYSTGNFGQSTYQTGPVRSLGLGIGQRLQGGHANTGCASSVASCRPALSPWFGGFNLLFWQYEDNYNRRLLAIDGGVPGIGVTSVSPDSQTGFDVFGGRYLDCGRYGFSVGYMSFNPGSEEVVVTPPNPGDYYATMETWNMISIDPDGAGAAPVSTVYALFDGASGYRLRRDVNFQGLEANIWSFGLMGAQRAAALCSQGSACGGLGNVLGLGSSYGAYGYGGATGPLVRSCSGRVRVATSHGLRWFQMEDEFQFAGNIDGTAGYQATDMYYDVDVDNNLLGYQFGSRLTYCLTERINLGISGKFGIYGNDVEMRQRIGTSTIDAYRTGTATDVINTHTSDTALATLGELDLGVGCRLNNAWTVRGGYRLLGATGVATSVDALNQEYRPQSSFGQVYADDSILLHGGYVGFDFNW